MKKYTELQMTHDCFDGLKIHQPDCYNDFRGYYWTIFNNKLYIFPTPGSNQGYFYYIPDYTVTAMDGTSSIDNFPKSYYEPVMIYAAYMSLGKQLLSLIQDTTDTSLSMDVLSKMINNNKPDSGGDVWDYLIDEDSEMVQATIGAMQAASALTKQKYDWYTQQMKQLQGQYVSFFGNVAKN